MLMVLFVVVVVAMVAVVVMILPQHSKHFCGRSRLWSAFSWLKSYLVYFTPGLYSSCNSVFGAAVGGRGGDGGGFGSGGGGSCGDDGGCCGSGGGSRGASRPLE